MEPQFAELLPEVLLGLGRRSSPRSPRGPWRPRPAPVVSTEHLHAPQHHRRASRPTSWPAQLRRLGRATFRRLSADCAGTYEVVARFLALLELYREGSVSFDQVTPLGELYVTWVAGTEYAAEAGPGTATDEEDG